MNSCSKCGLSLPNNYLTPVVFKNKLGQQKKGYLCITCRAEIDNKQKGQPNA